MNIKRRIYEIHLYRWDQTKNVLFLCCLLMVLSTLSRPRHHAAYWLTVGTISFFQYCFVIPPILVFRVVLLLGHLTYSSLCLRCYRLARVSISVPFSSPTRSVFQRPFNHLSYGVNRCPHTNSNEQYCTGSFKWLWMVATNQFIPDWECKLPIWLAHKNLLWSSRACYLIE